MTLKSVHPIVVFLVSAVVLVPTCMVASHVITVLSLIRQVPVYASTAKLRYPDPSPDHTFDSFRILQNTHAAQLVGKPWLAGAQKRLGKSSSEIARKIVDVKAKPIEDTAVITLRVESTDPVLASEFANAWAIVASEAYGTNEHLRPRLVDIATPSASPTRSKRKSMLYGAALGASLGLGLSLLAASARFVIKKWGEQPHPGYPPSRSGPEGS